MTRSDESAHLQAFAAADPLLQRMCEAETVRQSNKVILIASESLCPPAVRQALDSSLGNLYAEGYPSSRMSREERSRLGDTARFLAFHRRYGDRRYYKGCDFVNFVEAIAQSRLAELFATEAVPAERIFPNVQPLSGAAANNSVYNAFVRPGDTILGMALDSGGHLTHGSPVNRSGRFHNVVAYSANRKTGAIDMGEVRRLALEHRPRMIVAGFSAYPWTIDWASFREIADAVPGGPAILLADIAHPAGLVAAGVFPSPVGFADVVSFTTHKTLCGPRGAALLMTDRATASKVDFAVFPGEQGGPHQHVIASKAVSFLLAATEEFRTMQKTVVENAAALAEAFRTREVPLAYGGTNTHLLLIDLPAIETANKGPELKGSLASNLLDLCGITCNKNTIAGDTNANHPSAIRIGTTWITQRGARPEHMDRLGELITRILRSVHTYEIHAGGSILPRGKVHGSILRQTRRDVADWLESIDPGSVIYGPFSFERPDPPPPPTSAVPGGPFPIGAVKGPAVIDTSAEGLLEIRGERAGAFLEELTTGSVLELSVGGGIDASISDDGERVLSRLRIYRVENAAGGDARFLVLTPAAAAAEVGEHLRWVSDGYVLHGAEDLYQKVQGPVVVTDLRTDPPPEDRFVRLAATCAPDAVPPSTDPTAERHVMVAPDGTTDIIVRRDDAARLWNTLVSEVGLAPAAPPPAPTPASLRETAKRRPDLFGARKTFFPGHRSLVDILPPPPPLPEHGFAAADPEPLRRTPLHAEHLARTKKRNLVPFAGWEMPVLYDSIIDEHRAVREAAGIFDVAHMGTMEVSGPTAERFLDLVTTNFVPRLRIGQSHYSYLIDPNGHVIDDIIVYRRGRDRFLLVVNAANEDKDLAWLRAANEGHVLVDRDLPGASLGRPATLRHLKDPAAGDDRIVDIALQGPRTPEILRRLGGSAEAHGRVAELRKFRLVEVSLGGFDLIVSRTGYTGEELGYELLVHPDRAADLWRRLLEVGHELGLRPAGLGARDSLRTEAGLPLYGHELAGPHDILPGAAGYGAFVKRHKPFFVGRRPLLEMEDSRRMRVIRFAATRKGARVIHPGDLVVRHRGKRNPLIGWVTSCAVVGGGQIGLAYVKQATTSRDAELAIISLPQTGKERAEAEQEPPRLGMEFGNYVTVPEPAVVLPRFR